jgi:xylan 1,4-beta-xylosidase
MRASVIVFCVVTVFAGSPNLHADDSSPAASNSFPVSVQVDLTKTRGSVRPIWRFFGADEPNYATMKNGSKLIAELGELAPQHVYFRAHNLLTSGDGTPAMKWGSTGAYSEDEHGNPVYTWKILDGIFDTYLKCGVKPYAQIGFMPKELSTHPEPYQHDWRPGYRYGNIFTGWSYPPNDYRKWGDLAYEWVKHCVSRYGRKEVESWYWEVWNEPNIGYWHGTPEEFLKLHDYAIDGVRRALPTAKVGGADTAGSGGRFTRNFLEHCLRGTNFATGKIGTPLDFLSFHAKGAPSFTNNHVRMGIGAQLNTVADACRIYASYPELKDKPIVIGESDPDGCAACDAAVYPANGYRNTPQFASYTAAVFARKPELAERSGVNLEGAVTWAFEFEDARMFDGFRTLASNGIDKPVLNVFRMFSKMTGQRVAADSDGAVPLDEIMRHGVRGQPDVSALASLDGNKLCVMVWHYHDDDVPGPVANVRLEVAGVPMWITSARVEHYRIDEEHSNAYTVWQRLGSPQHPTKDQYAQIEKAGKLARLDQPAAVSIRDGKALLEFNLPRKAVSLLVVEWTANPNRRPRILSSPAAGASY